MKHLRQYIRGFLLEKKEGKDAEWQYLLSEPFQARNHLACAWCKDAESILEVGSYRNPIYEFYPGGSAQVITTVDPKGNTFEGSRRINGRDVHINSFGEKLHDLDIPAHQAVIALGLHIPDQKKGVNPSYEALQNLCKEAETVVLEGSVDWPDTVDQIEEIIGLLEQHEKVVDIKVDYSASDIRDPGAPGPVHDDRRLVVLRRHSWK